MVQLHWSIQCFIKKHHICFFYNSVEFTRIDIKFSTFSLTVACLPLIPPHCLWVFDPQTPDTFLRILLGNNEVMSKIATILTKTWQFLIYWVSSKKPNSQYGRRIRSYRPCWTHKGYRHCQHFLAPSVSLQVISSRRPSSSLSVKKNVKSFPSLTAPRAALISVS